jgi:hypothetical protein
MRAVTPPDDVAWVVKQLTIRVDEMIHLRTLIFGIVVALGADVVLPAAAAEAPPVKLSRGDRQVTVVVGDVRVATYYFQDKEITRPYFAHVRTLDGVPVTRHHPPVEGQDVMDHPTFHPGIWMAFGDLSGSDNWRLKAPVRHVDFVDEPTGGTVERSFAVRNEYLSQEDPNQIVCQELARYTVLIRPTGWLLVWDSTFTSSREFYLGDQEEMGLGIRIATPLRVDIVGKGNLPPGTGTILDSQGRKNGNEIGGNSADWCDYSGTLDGKHVGISIFCHPVNFRPSWFHARDYGLLAANPFGRRAFRKGDVSKVVVRPGESLRLRYGVFIHSEPSGNPPESQRPALAEAYQDYVRMAGK